MISRIVICLALAAVVITGVSLHVSGQVTSPTAPVASSGGPVQIGSVGGQTPAPTAGSAVDFTGSWSLVMTDTSTRSLNATLFQNDNVVMGRGTIAAAGSIQDVTLTGTAGADALDLFVVPVGGSEVYVMSLALDPSGIFGRYTAYNARGGSWTGTVSVLGAGVLPIIGTAGGAITTTGPTGVTVGQTGIPPVIQPGATPLVGDRRTVSKSYSSTSDGTTTTTTTNNGGTVTTSGGVSVSPDGDISVNI